MGTDDLVVADNWGGLFEGIPTVVHEPVPVPDATSTDQIHDVKASPSTGNEVVDKNQDALQQAERSVFLVARAE